MADPISKFYQSFSGTDTIAFLMMPGCTPIVIGSLTTISYSMYRNKKPVINIGRTNINGVTRGSRIFAGTMIFTLINQHWLRELQSQWSEKYYYGNGYLFNINELKVDELPLFDIMIVSANEYGSAVSMFIFGIDFTDEAQTISVEDLFTENTFSFIARDISVFKRFSTDPDVPNSVSSDETENVTIKDINPIQSFLFDNENFDWTDTENSIHEFLETKKEIDAIRKHEADSGFIRDLSTTEGSNFGSDVVLVQDALRRKEYYDGIIDGLFDEEVSDAVRKFQSANGLTLTGYVDRKTWDGLMSDTTATGKKTAVVVNKNNANIYVDPNLASTIVGSYGYNDSFFYDEVKKDTNEQGTIRYFLRTEKGWVYANDVYSINFDNETVDFPTLSRKANNSTPYIIILQNALAAIYNEFQFFRYGIYDDETIKFVNKFQIEYGDKYGLTYNDGVVTQELWIAIESESGEDFNSGSNKNFSVDMNRKVGDYKFSYKELQNGCLNNFYVTIRTNSQVVTKVSAIAHFKDGSTETVSDKIIAKDGSKISANDCTSENHPIVAVFFEDEENGGYKKAEWVEYIIYPYNFDPYKWTFHFFDE